MDNKHPDSSVQKLLDELDQKQDDRVGVAILHGRAVSRSATNIHLAVRGGIVAVPITSVEEVAFLSKTQPNAVRLAVRNPMAIQALLRAKPVGALGGGISGGAGTVETARDGDIVYTNRTFQMYQGVATCTYTDTDTTSGGAGQPDQCDDCEPDSCPADDTAE